MDEHLGVLVGGVAAQVEGVGSERHQHPITGDRRPGGGAGAISPRRAHAVTQRRHERRTDGRQLGEPVLVQGRLSEGLAIVGVDERRAVRLGGDEWGIGCKRHHPAVRGDRRVARPAERAVTGPRRDELAMDVGRDQHGGGVGRAVQDQVPVLPEAVTVALVDEHIGDLGGCRPARELGRVRHEGDGQPVGADRWLVVVATGRGGRPCRRRHKGRGVPDGVGDIDLAPGKVAAALLEQAPTRQRRPGGEGNEAPVARDRGLEGIEGPFDEAGYVGDPGRAPAHAVVQIDLEPAVGARRVGRIQVVHRDERRPPAVGRFRRSVARAVALDAGRGLRDQGGGRGRGRPGNCPGPHHDQRRHEGEDGQAGQQPPLRARWPAAPVECMHDSSMSEPAKGLASSSQALRWNPEADTAAEQVPPAPGVVQATVTTKGWLLNT